MPKIAQKRLPEPKIRKSLLNKDFGHQKARRSNLGAIYTTFAPNFGGLALIRGAMGSDPWVLTLTLPDPGFIICA